METQTLPGGTFRMADDIIVNRMGYGAMQLAGPGVFGPPEDPEEAIAVLKEVALLGINHIDTSDFYGPHVTNKLIRQALFPYVDELHIVTKVGARRDDQGNWLPATSPDELRQAVFDNLNNLGLEELDVVNYRAHGGGPNELSHDSIKEPFRVLARLQAEGLIRHLGVSNVSQEQINEARDIAPIVCVQNLYNIANRQDDTLIDSLAEEGIAYVPFFPLGGFTPLQSDILNQVAARNNSTPLSIALAWLLQRAPNILLIPGTSSVDHLHENIEGAGQKLSEDDLKELDQIGRS